MATRPTHVVKFLDWYGTNATQFQQHLEDYYATFQKPLWVTEWACEDYVNPEDICSLQDIITFMSTTQAYLDGASYVERYAWFGAQQNLTIVDSVRLFRSKSYVWLADLVVTTPL